METVNHLLITSDFANIIWQHFATKIWIFHHARSVEELLRTWLEEKSRRSQLGFTILGIIFYGLWEIWKTRCKALFENIAIPPEQTIRTIYSHIQTLNAVLMP